MRASFPATERHLLRTEAWVPRRTKRYRSQIAAKAGRNTVTRKPRRPCKATFHGFQRASTTYCVPSRVPGGKRGTPETR